MVFVVELAAQRCMRAEVEDVCESWTVVTHAVKRWRLYFNKAVIKCMHVFVMRCNEINVN